MGPLLSDIAGKMQRKINSSLNARADEDEDDDNAARTKLLVHSTHDTALAALAATLDVYDEKCVFGFCFLSGESIASRPCLC